MCILIPTGLTAIPFLKSLRVVGAINYADVRIKAFVKGYVSYDRIQAFMQVVFLRCCKSNQIIFESAVCRVKHTIPCTRGKKKRFLLPRECMCIQSWYSIFAVRLSIHTRSVWAHFTRRLCVFPNSIFRSRRFYLHVCELVVPIHTSYSSECSSGQSTCYF